MEIAALLIENSRYGRKVCTFSLVKEVSCYKAGCYID